MFYYFNFNFCKSQTIWHIARKYQTIKHVMRQLSRWNLMNFYKEVILHSTSANDFKHNIIFHLISIHSGISAAKVFVENRSWPEQCDHISFFGCMYIIYMCMICCQTDRFQSTFWSWEYYQQKITNDVLQFSHGTAGVDQNELEQLERLCSEDTHPCLTITQLRWSGGYDYVIFWLRPM